MHFDYRFAYIKTESRALDVIAARFIHLVEALEYFFALLRGNSGTRVYYLYKRCVFVIVCKYAYGAVFRELDRVVHKIVYDLMYHILVGGDRYGMKPVKPGYFNVLALYYLLERQQHVEYFRTYVKRLRFQL